MNELISKILLFLGALVFIVAGAKSCAHLEDENARLRANQEALISEKEGLLKSYKVVDSLNAMRINELQLNIEEFERLAAKDANLIKELTKERDLASTITTTIIKYDTIVVAFKDITDSLKCFNYKSKWSEISGCLNTISDTAELQIKNKEALRVIETVKYKRFLGFLWKTRRVKSRRLDIISENPATEIVSCEKITIAEKQ